MALILVTNVIIYTTIFAFIRTFGCIFYIEAITLVSHCLSKSRHARHLLSQSLVAKIVITVTL